MRVRLELQVGNTPAHLPPLWVEVGDDNLPQSEEALRRQIQILRRRLVATSYRMLAITVRDTAGRVLKPETQAGYPWLGALLRHAHEWFAAPPEPAVASDPPLNPHPRDQRDPVDGRDR